MNATAQRNENVAVFLIDTNAIKESNIRVGTNPTAVREPNAETQYFATEHGQRPADLFLLRPQSALSSWHGDAFWSHQNSVFNARTFFQVGAVQPSHRNLWGGRVTGTVPYVGALSFTLNQRDIRGMVNGNVLVPLANERTPKTTDPARRAIVQRFLDAYPNQLPNRPDFDIRALNTNASQRIDQLGGTARLDRDFPRGHRLLLSHTLDRQRIDAFQFVAGQNPDTELHTHRARIGWLWTIGPKSNLLLSAQFSRARSLLVSEPNAVGPRVRMGFQIEELGPDSMFPVDRAANTFRYGAAYSRISGRHEVAAGGDFARFQLNGIESGNVRGYFQFTNNFGRSAIDNLLLGTPSIYEVAVGDISRGYRNWSANAWVADRWRIHSRLRIYAGLHWSADSRPVEVHGKDRIPFSTDWNNFAPRLSLAWQIGRGWVGRAMYAASFSQILPVTYQQVRNNPPIVTYVQVPDPDLVDPLGGIDLSDPNRRYTPTWLSPDLVAPYSHQYNAGVEKRLFWDSTLRLDYIGSRTIKLLNSFILNRAEPVTGIPLTSATVNERRPDPRYYETRTVVNGGIGYFDALAMGWSLPVRRGLTASVGYSFSKAIDEGVDFSATAANKDILSQRSQWQYEAFRDRKGLSNFHAPHALQFSYSWDLPVPSFFHGWARGMASGWQIAGVHLWKSGTPFTLFIGSDAPGFGNVDGGPSDRPNLLDPSILGMTITDPNTAPQIISRESFAFIHPGERSGNLGRNTFRKATIWNWNAAIQRQIRFSGDWILLLRGEAYNLSNTPQFDEPQRNLSSPSFGKITNTLNDGRVLQFGMRIVI